MNAHFKAANMHTPIASRLPTLIALAYRKHRVTRRIEDSIKATADECGVTTEAVADEVGLGLFWHRLKPIIA